MLDDLLNDEKYKGLPFLLIANKQEKNQPVKVNEICEKWDITNIFKNRLWSFRSDSKEELTKALDWLSEQMPKID